MMKYTFVFVLLVILANACNQKKDSTTNQGAPSTDETTVATYDAQTGLHWPTPKTAGEEDVVEKDLTKKNYYVVLDGSGSMADSGCADGKTREEAAKQALVVFSSKIPDDANLGLLVFDDSGVREVVALKDNNKKQFVDAVLASKNGGGTPLASSMKEAVKQLGVQSRKQLSYGTYDLIVVTDGESSFGENPADVVDFVVEHTPIKIHTIGFCIDSTHSLNQPEKVAYKSATNTEDLSKGLESVLAESESFSVDSFSK